MKNLIKALKYLNEKVGAIDYRFEQDKMVVHVGEDIKEYLDAKGVIYLESLGMHFTTQYGEFNFVTYS